MDAVAKSPGMGHLREDLTADPVRFYRVHRYLIIYAPGNKPIGIVRILHASRDVRSLLDHE